MFIRFDEHRVTVHTTYNGFRRRGAVERASHEDWVRIMKETAAVERKMALLKQVGATIYTG